MSGLIHKSKTIINNNFINGNDFIYKHKSGKNIENVTLKIDKNGYIVYWIPKAMKKPNPQYFIFIDDIVDVRTSLTEYLEYEPMKDYYLFQIVTNTDIVNEQFFSFQSKSHEIIKNWYNFLFKLAYTYKKTYRGLLYFIEKIFTPTIYVNNYTLLINSQEMRILFLQYTKEYLMECKDKGKDKVNRKKILINEYIKLADRYDLRRVFDEITDGDDYMTLEKFKKFINETQRDCRLNEDINLLKTTDDIKKIIRNVDCKENSDKERISFIGFCQYLLSDQNSDVMTSEFKLKISDMNYPLPLYYINSSHNTYLNGHQINAAKHFSVNQRCEATVEMYKQVLLSGCRCIELDLWDGNNGEPVVTHGPEYLLKINTIELRKVCYAIKDYAFKTSDYPLILSLENHLSNRQEEKCAEIFEEIFENLLLKRPLPDYPLEEGIRLPSPAKLKKKILLKGTVGDNWNVNNYNHKNLSYHHKPIERVFKEKKASQVLLNDSTNNIDRDIEKNFSIQGFIKTPSNTNLQRQYNSIKRLNSKTPSNTKLYKLFNYIQNSKKISINNPDFIMNSLSEQKLDKLITRDSITVTQYTQRHLVRVYPEINRICSSNFIPIFFWSSGCQMAALNFQTNGLSMQMNNTIFEDNGNCGYLLKPKILREKNYKADVFASSLLISNTIEIEIISIHFLSPFLPFNKNNYDSDNKNDNDKYGVTIIADLYDLPGDSCRGKQKTTVFIDRNNLSNILLEDSRKIFIFPKIIKPEYAMIHLKVENKYGSDLFQRFIPVHRIQPGYRHIIMRNNANKNVGPVSLFVKINVKLVNDNNETGNEIYSDPLKFNEIFNQDHEDLIKCEENDVSIEKEITRQIETKTDVFLQITESYDNEE
ncbi:Phospholipase C, phosphatidylinositol-specific, X domain and Phosphoinositide phospholipase C family and Phospholipase C, phosphatidylinositol-specific, Y domain and EF-hand domain pair and Pleckstrin homology-like domain and Phospholipase C, phosphoinositol-specific, EF-hand-like domain and PLC-like phosphodiesterase, TIM beta/alpha-barrel domain-containing protein [Strongyloides ratti]|uniref:Phosphoinositide phospholipase C n=1 Tax=Strongyloides ratti TaxID=34506 RepID=A0A090LQN9_STRRB|nr:Phospholipase C, phosphatidylinositol-specific, X domain and Phosphoinositide phospholipase C family and Phospholipase C, phosphatidylinositol-specific, Y domain and EF-hand domain pair and Pleckstrin homology-like domain and Phospholipase C, phosphoinositol-specific, EF-hand-like domain and PLC-like phosphodiesterase, TIM beta/alpha-barrel domain-containing protein [Strongyloides ratti]CEF70496.1 Phospholipase C, phosphatidylinositol-specific, X domain and Phosphoinositide phospholipase C fami